MILHLTNGQPDPLPGEAGQRMTVLDLYDLAEANLSGIHGVSLAMGCDQIFLSRTPLLTEFVMTGGRVLVNGHVQRPILPGLGRWRRLDFHGPEDLRITQATPHPIWEGVDYDELLFRTGVPGVPTGKQLAKVGVAGFYGRGYHADLPKDTTVLNGIGPHRLPLDILFPLGAGQVLAHAGNDLIGFADAERSTRHLGTRLMDWLEGK